MRMSLAIPMPTLMRTMVLIVKLITGDVDAEPNHETNFMCVGSLTLIRAVNIPVCDWIDTNSVTTMYVNGVGA